MDSSENLTGQLLREYREILSAKGTAPEWAVHKRNRPGELVRCTIPFVGKQYSEQEKRILVYASAENLSGYYPGNDREWPGDWLDDDHAAENRHRRCFEDAEEQDDPFFPQVHISPMNNGSLAVAVRYLASFLLSEPKTAPRDFYETIAFANNGKYSIETELQRSLRLGSRSCGTGANIDYAGKKQLLSESHAMLEADLRILRPDYLILPGSILKADRAFIEQNKGRAILIPIFQMNARVINQYIAPCYAPYPEDRLTPVIRTWYTALGRGGMTGKSKAHYLSVFPYLDEVIKNEGCLREEEDKRGTEP